MLITKRLDELTPDEFTRILSPKKGSALDAKTVVLGSKEHACCSLNAGTLDINASRDFSNTVQTPTPAPGSTPRRRTQAGGLRLARPCHEQNPSRRLKSPK